MPRPPECGGDEPPPAGTDSRSAMRSDRITSLYGSEIGAPFSNLKHDVKGFLNCADKSGRCVGWIFAHTGANAFHLDKDPRTAKLCPSIAGFCDSVDSRFFAATKKTPSLQFDRSRQLIVRQRVPTARRATPASDLSRCFGPLSSLDKARRRQVAAPRAAASQRYSHTSTIIIRQPSPSSRA
jgi:hypothetical protein